MSDSRDKAKLLLNHYIQSALHAAGRPTDSDSTIEINEIVDHIIDAAVEEVFKRIEDKIRSVSKS